MASQPNPPSSPSPSTTKNAFETLATGTGGTDDVSVPLDRLNLGDGVPASKPKPKSGFDEDMSDYESENEPELMETDAPVNKKAPSVVPRHQVVLEQIPKNFLFREKTKAYVLEEFDGIPLDAIHKDYRQKDRPDLDGFKTDRQPAQILFADKKFSAGAGSRQSKGHLDPKHGPAEKLIKISFNNDSQMPSVRLHITRDDVVKVGAKPKEVIYQIFANSIRPAEGDGLEKKAAGIEMQTWHEKMSDVELKQFKKQVARGHDNLVEMAARKNLMRLRVRLITPPTSSKAKYKCRPMFSGLPALELQTIRTKGNDENTANDLTDFERTIFNLDTAEHLEIFRRVDCNDPEVMEKFKNFFVGSMYLCSAFRNFWVYQFQQEMPEPGVAVRGSQSIFNKECNLELLQPPRWMVTKYTAFSNGPGEPTRRVEALNWSAFSEMNAFPSVDDCAFLLRLGLARERESQKTVIRNMMNSAKGGCKAQFEPLTGMPGGFIVKISLPGPSAGFNAELVKPEFDARLELVVQVPGKKANKYVGSVIEAPADDVGQEAKFDWDFVAQVIGPVFEFEEGSEPIVDLKFVDDSTSGHRARVALEEMSSKKLARKEGVDIPAVVFRTRSSIAPEEQNAGRDIDEHIFDAMLQRLEKIWGLNEEQIDAVVQTFRSETGLALIYGPPGTGKTTTTTAAAREHCLMSNKVLYTCPSNKAVDAALNAFLKQRKPGKDDDLDGLDERTIRAVRFVGGYKTFEERKKLVDPGADVEEWDGIVNPTITAAAKQNPGYMFHEQLNKAITKYAASDRYSMNELAKDYHGCVEKATTLKGKKRRDNAKNLRILEEQLTEYFLKHEVDIIFTTCSSACHPTLNANFTPSAAFIDEAGQATIPDACMALDPFKESIKWLILSGDYNQLMPIVTAKDANEGLHALEASLFYQLIKDPNQQYPHVMLTTQHRQHPDLSAYANTRFYDEQLKNAPSTLQGTPVQKTVKQFFNQLGKGRKNANRVRIGIDVSGDSAASIKYAETTSFCNRAEAEMIVGLVKKLLDYTPEHAAKDARKFAKVEARNIGIITPYKGQQRLLRNLLRDAGHDSVAVKVLTEGNVSTIWGIQGSEVDIGFISLCVNDPKGPAAKLRFVAMPNALCVANTRARLFQVTTGNFKGWCEATAAEKGKGINHPRYEAFKYLVKHHYDQGDIVSSEDVQATLLAAPGKASTLAKPHFYTEVIPSMELAQLRSRGTKRQNNPSLYQSDARKGKKNKGVTYSTEGTTAPTETPLNPLPDNKGLSNKERKAAYQANLRAKEAEAQKQKEASDALLNEGKRAKPVPAPAPAPADGFDGDGDIIVDWADDVQAAEEAKRKV